MEHALEDTLVLVPFLFVTYTALEALEHAAGARANAVVRRAGAAGPVAGALLGVVPQCGFSAMAATLYAGRVVTLGTLVAVFLSTSDEMLPMLVAERVDAGLLLRVLGLKVLVALITGVLADPRHPRAAQKRPRAHILRRTVLSVRRDGMEADVVDQMAEGGETAEHICRLCASRIIAAAVPRSRACAWA
ncbi:MAG: putative manganese transporter [Collinsella sp.]